MSTKLFVIEHRCWSWSKDLLLPGVAGSLPEPEDIKGLNALASQLSGGGITNVYCSDCEDTGAVADAMAQMLSGEIKVFKKPELREMNFGLWQGLTVGEVRRRYSKAYRQWREDPVTTAPQTGESFDMVADRLLDELNAAVRKNRGGNMLMVLSPLSAAILHCRLYGRDLSAALENLTESREIRTYDLDRISLVEEPQ